ncbi:cytochrome c, mono- and diheme variants family [Burkholderiales bacterium JOSHI_001]|nr:cytochrome c, mono- and diheme variants family [Burkholderiales bacterium JOSHI_001]
MKRLAATCVGAVLATAAVTAAFGFGGVGTITGRMVLPAADAPSLTPARSDRGQFVLHCAGCHGLDAAGSPAQYVPDLRRLGQFLQVPGGREFIISVPGVMGSGLNDEQVARVINWLLATLAAGSAPWHEAPYTREEVARARAKPLVDVAGRRRELIEMGRSLGLTLH